MTEAYATQREFDALSRRVEQMDVAGTRGVSALSIQVQELAKDVGSLQRESVRSWDAHAALHRQDIDRRNAQRKWVVMATIGGTASTATIISMLATLLAHH